MLLICSCFCLHAQEYKEDLKTANKEIYLLTDSLWSLEKLYLSKSIDEKTYLAGSGELLNALSAMAYSNASNYTRQNEPNVSEIVGEIVPEIMQPESLEMFESVDTIPKENNMEGVVDYSPPRNPISLITGAGRRTTFKIRYGMFWNGLTQGNSLQNINYPNFKLGSSFHWLGELDLLLQTRLGKNKLSPWSIYYGIGLDNREFTQKDDPQQLTLNSQNKAAFIVPLIVPSSEKLEEATLNLSYFRIPVGFQFKKKKFAINVGSYLGFMTSHKQSLEYSTADGEEAELILDKEYNLEKTIYGLSASLGFKRVHVAFNYDLNTLFKANDQYEYNAWKIGLMIF